MSYRLDEGNGTCVYRLGVEDDGCHSLMDYANVAESARILECIARSLNAVVTERKIIQNEIVETESGQLELNTTTEPSVALEPALWNRNVDKEHKEEVADHGADHGANDTTTTIIQKQGPGNYTRAEITIHRVETHLLDHSPISLVEMANSETAMNGSTAHAAASKAAVDPSSTKNHSQQQEHLSVGETLSARNIRIAVVGNVDAGTFEINVVLRSSLTYSSIAHQVNRP